MIEQDSKKNEEYHMDESNLMGGEFSSESVDHSTQHTTNSATVDEAMNKSIINQELLKKIIIVCIGLIVLILISRYMNFKRSVNDDKSHLAAISAQVPQPPATQSSQSLQASPAPAILPTPNIDSSLSASASSVDKAKLDQVLQQSEQNQGQIQNLSQEITKLQTSTQNLSSKMDAILSHIEVLNKKIDAQEEQKNVLEKIRRQTPFTRHHSKHKKPIGIRDKYYLQASIPGRAWLIKRNGTDTITVRVGTSVPGYGKVLKIDDEKGRVVMSNGKIIGFGQWDS